MKSQADIWRSHAKSRINTKYWLVLAATAITLTVVTFGSLFRFSSTEAIPTNGILNAGSGQSGGSSSSESSGRLNVPTCWASLPLDHNNYSEGTFQNRYWINTEHYKPGGPVFVFDAGESDGSRWVERFLLRNTSFSVQLQKEFHGMGILWEHRYYGESLPFPINQSSSAETFRFLTLDQALADIPYFARDFNLSAYPDADLRPSITPWVMMGCSYSGARAALSRLRYPDTIFAAYAGSPVVKFSPGVDEYYDQLHHALVDHGHSNCSKDLHAITQYVDAQLDNPGSRKSVIEQFLGSGTAHNSNEDFTLALTLPFINFKAWGIDAGNDSITSLCEYLEVDPVRNQPASPDGLAASYGAAFMTTRLASWPPLLERINKQFNTSCGNTSIPTQDRCNLAMFEAFGTTVHLSWFWQQCSELGFFIVENPGPHSLVSKHQSLGTFASAICRRWFPDIQRDGFATFKDTVAHTNARFGGLDMRPSNVFWTTGEFDPWRSLSPLARSQVERGSSPVRISHQIPPCNVQTSRDTVFGYVVPGAPHCSVIAKNGTEVDVPRRMFADALHEWLECF